MTSDRRSVAGAPTGRSVRRASVGLRDLPGFLSELERRGATEIHRRPVRFDGSVRVMWTDPVDTRLRLPDFSANLRAGVSAYALGAAFLALVVVVFGFVQIFGGGLG